MSPLIEVAAGLLQDSEGRWLIARRHDHQHQGGLWEFPGGKRHLEETWEQALARELAEELGIHIGGCRELLRVKHDYGDRRILLNFMRVLDFCGTPHGREGQALEWRQLHQLNPEDFPAADRPVLSALNLPECCAITDETLALHPPSDRIISRLAAQGLGMVQLRAPMLDDATYQTCVEHWTRVTKHHGLPLFLNRSPRSAPPRSGVSGYHLNRHLLATWGPAMRGLGLAWGASCHDAVELALAQKYQAHYAFLSPVRPTASHPGNTPLGWSAFSTLTYASALPVYALGGMAPADLPQIKTHGGFGAAGIGAFWT